MKVRDMRAMLDNFHDETEVYFPRVDGRGVELLPVDTVREGFIVSRTVNFLDCQATFIREVEAHADAGASGVIIT